MYGVMVVPINATTSTRNALVLRKCGHTRLLITSLPFGWPRKAAIGYARKASVRMRNKRSALEYEPITVSTHTPTAAIGIETYLETPRISMAAPTPANSLTVRPALATSSSTSAPVVPRTENCSRIRPPSPSPVNAPRREHISWTTTRATVMSTITNRVR